MQTRNTKTLVLVPVYLNLRGIALSAESNPRMAAKQLPAHLARTMLSFHTVQDGPKCRMCRNYLTFINPEAWDTAVCSCCLGCNRLEFVVEVIFFCRAAEHSRKEPLSSAVHPSTLSAVLAHHCISLRFVLRPPSPSDGVLQNKEGAACLGRIPFFYRRRGLPPTAQEVVCDQRTQLPVSGKDSVLSKRRIFFLFERVPHFASEQVHTVWTCEWDFIFCPSPAAAFHRRNTLLQKRAVRRERWDVAAVHVWCTFCGACAPFAYSGAPSFSQSSCSCWRAFRVRELLFFTLPGVGCFASCSRLVAWFHTTQERTGHFRMDVNVYTHTYTQVRARGEGEPTCLSTVACSVRSPEQLRVATARLLGTKYIFVASLLLLFLYVLMTRGEEKRLSFFVSDRHPLAPHHFSVLASVDALFIGGVQHASPVVVFVVGLTVAVIVLIPQTCSCSRHSAAAEGPDDRRVREIIQKRGKTAPFGLPAFWSVMILQLQNRGSIHWERNQVSVACPLFVFAIVTVAVVYFPFAVKWALVFRWRGLATAAASSPSSSAFTLDSFYPRITSCCSRNVITSILKSSLSAGMASSICVMVLSRKIIPSSLSESRRTSLSRLNFVSMRRAGGTRKDHAEQLAATLSNIATTARVRRVVILLSMTVGFLSSCAAQSQQFSSRRHHLLSFVVFSVSTLFRGSRTLLLNPRRCHSFEATAVFAGSWIDLQQRTATTQKQSQRQIPLHCGRHVINITKSERDRWTTPHSPYREALPYLCIPAKKQLLSAAAPAGADGRILKERHPASTGGVFQRKILYTRAAGNQHRSHCYIDARSVRFEERGNNKESHCSPPSCDSFQTPKKGLSFQLYSSVCVGGAPLTISHSTSASRAVFASTLLLALVAPRIAAACFFLVLCLGLYLVCPAQASPFRCPHHLLVLCPSVFHWIFGLPTFPVSFSLRRLSLMAFAAEPGVFLPLSNLVAPFSVSSGYLWRGIFVEHRRSRGQLNCLNSICVFSACSPVSDDIDICYFASSASSPLLLSSWGVVISPFPLYSYTVLFIAAFDPFVISFCSLRCLPVTFSCFTLVPGMKGSVFVPLFPSVLCTAVAFVPCCCCTCGCIAGVCLLCSQFVSPAGFVNYSACAIRIALISPTIAVLPCLSRPSGISATGLAAAASGRMPAAAGSMPGGIAGWCTVLAKYHAGTMRTHDALRSSFAAAPGCGNFFPLTRAAAAAGSTGVAGKRKAGLAAFVFYSILHDVSTEERMCSRLSPPSASVAAPASQGGETRSMIYFHSQSHSRTFPLPFGRISAAADRVTLLLTAVLNVILLCCRSHFPTPRPFFHRGFFRSSPWWPSLSVRSRPRCCSSFVCSPALLLLLLLLLSWILSSAEFTVVSDVDENIFLDLAGGLPEKQDSLLVRMAAGRRFSILNLDRQKFEIMPSAYRSEAFQILFETVADRRNLTNPLACDRSLPRVRYSAYFIFASPLADFWEQLPAPSGSSQATDGAPPSSPSDIYRFSWPRGYQAVSLGTGLCIQVVEKQVNAKHTLNVMFLASSASPSSQQPSAIRNVSLWVAVSLAVALLPLL